MTESSEITRVFIFGSCVSRDAFGNPADPGVSIVDFYARTSLASLATKPLSASIDLSNIESKFQRRMVERDLTKGGFAHLTKCDFDVLLMDFIDDRFALFMLPDGAGITYSPEFIKSNYDLGQHDVNKIMPFSDEYIFLWELGWNILKEGLLQASNFNKLLINKVFLSCCDNAGVAFEYLHYINTFNKYLERIYKKLEHEIPMNQFIDYQDIEFIGNANHIWGRQPFHYSNEIYERCRSALKYFHADFLASRSE